MNQVVDTSAASAALLMADIKAKHDVKELRRRLEGTSALIIGGGEIVLKKLPFIIVFRELGGNVYVTDIKENPTARIHLEPHINEFIWSATGDVAARRLREIIGQGTYAIMDISTWPDSHMLTAFRYQDIADIIVTTKPVDSSRDILKTMHDRRSDPDFESLLSKILVHDHYGNRTVVDAMAALMPEWQSKYGAVREIQIFIIEAKSVSRELHRVEALAKGISLDLLPHALRLLTRLLPIGATWQPGPITFNRESLRFSIKGGARAFDISYPINAGNTETFVAVSLEGHQITGRKDHRGETLRSSEDRFDVLVIAGKGVASQRENRDFKGILMRFDTGDVVHVDLDSQRIREPDGRVSAPDEHKTLHRGLNAPWIEMLSRIGDTDAPPSDLAASLFQPWIEAYKGMDLISEAHALPIWNRGAYRPGEDLQTLVNRIPPELWGDRKWHMAELPAIQIGTVSTDNVIA